MIEQTDERIVIHGTGLTAQEAATLLLEHTESDLIATDPITGRRYLFEAVTGFKECRILSDKGFDVSFVEPFDTEIKTYFTWEVRELRYGTDR